MSDAPLALMVVQDLLLRQRVEEGLRAAGYRTVGAAGPSRMRERLADERPSVAVVDLETDGIAAPEIAELAAAGVPVLGFCAHTAAQLKAAGLAAGCARVVTRGEVAIKLDRLVAEIVGATA